MNLFYKKVYKDKKRNKVNVFFYFMSFTIPFVVTTLALIALHITPFGKHNLAISDAQYYINNELFFSRLLKGSENFLYSLNNGLGGNEWSQLAWGGIGFGNLLSVFSSLETIPSVFTWICTTNISLCGITMYALLDYFNRSKISNLLFSTSYALIGFNVVNCYQTLFFIGPQFLPLVILGLIYLYNKKTPLIYVASLALSIFLNFYFGFHLCVISAVLFLVLLLNGKFNEAKEKKTFAINWLACSGIGGLLAAPMWLPAIKAYSGGGRLNQTISSEYTFNENMPFIRIFSKLFSGANSTNELVSGMPNIFCGILVVSLVILFFMNKKIEAKKKHIATIVLGIYLVSFYIRAFTIIMHGGTHTNWFPYRYSYVFSFLLICLAAEEYNFIDFITIEDTKKCGIVLLISSLIVFDDSYSFISGGMVLLDFFILFIMWVGFWFYKNRPDKAPLHTFSLLLLFLVCINLYANFIVSTNNVKNWELDLDEYSKNVFVSGSLVDALNLSEDSFFRMEKDYSESGSIGADSYLYNYNGVSHSGPAERKFIHMGLNKLGINWFDMRHWYEEGVPSATDTLLGLKYIVSKNNLELEKNYEKVINLDETSIYKNPNAFSLAILSNVSINGVVLENNVFENLNNIYKTLTGDKGDIFVEQDEVVYTLFTDYSIQSVTSQELRESVSNTVGENEKNNTNSYISFEFEAIKDGSVYKFDTSIPESSAGLSYSSIGYVGTYKKGEIVNGKIPLNDGISSGEMMRGYCANLSFAYLDNDVLSEYAETINSRNITFDVIHENNLKGTFTAQENECILFTIPWDEGWTCYIDGEKTKIDKTWDLFMSVEVPKGTHNYEMKFFPAWMNYGIYMFGFSFVGLIVLLIINRKNKSVIVKGDSEKINSEIAQ